MEIKGYSAPRKTTKNSKLIRVAVPCVLVLLIVTLIGLLMIPGPNQQKDDAAKSLGLMRVVSVDNSEYIATIDGVCIAPATFIKDERTHETIIWVKQGDTMHAIQSEQDLMNMCK